MATIDIWNTQVHVTSGKKCTYNSGGKNSSERANTRAIIILLREHQAQMKKKSHKIEKSSVWRKEIKKAQRKMERKKKNQTKQPQARKIERWNWKSPESGKIQPPSDDEQ